MLVESLCQAMSTIVTGSIPSDEFALHHTLSTVPGLEVECERVVKSGEKAVMPLLWMRGASRETIDDALRADETVEAIECLSAFDEELFYSMEWHGHIRLLLHMLTSAEATVLDAYGWRDRWQLRILYPTRADLAETHEFAEEHGITFDIASVREMDGEPAGRFGLSERQYDALLEATRKGYFKVPREASLQDIAEGMDISHQALSERLRRGVDALVEDTLLVGAVPETEKKKRARSEEGGHPEPRSV